MGDQDAAIFHRYAEYLWRQAGGIVARRALAGALVGAALGAVMLTSWANWPLPHRDAYLLMVLGAVSGAFLGRSSGAARAMGLRLQAQLAQHQLQFERYALAQGQVLPEPDAPTSDDSPDGASADSTPAAEPVAAVEVPEVPVVVAEVPEVPVAAVEPVPEDRQVPRYGWKAIEPANS